MILINEQRLLQIYHGCWQFSQLVLIVLIGQMFQLFSLDTKIIKYAPYLRLVSLAFGVTKIAQLSSKVTLTENARWGTVLNGRIYGYLVMVAFFTAIKKSTSHVDSTHCINWLTLNSSSFFQDIDFTFAPFLTPQKMVKM